MRSWVPAASFDRYTSRFAPYRLSKEEAERQSLTEQISVDGLPA